MDNCDNSDAKSTFYELNSSLVIVTFYIKI